MKKRLLVFTPIFLCALIIFSSLSPVITLSEDISNKVFRLHIIANSDSKEDQNLKLEVRDQVLKYSKEIYSDCTSVNDAVEVTNANLNKIKDIAQKTIAFNGYDYDTKVYTAKEFFNVRKYDDFILPAGNYYSLKIIIGEGKGRNWWCVMFPSVCLSGCTDDFDETLSEEEKKMIEDKKYVVRFKAAEIYERVKNKISGN